MSHNPEPAADVFSDRPLVPMDDLHKELRRVAHGSSEEQEILKLGRERVEHKTDEFRAIRNAGLKAAAASSPERIVRQDASRDIGETAVELITGEHELPAPLGPDSPQVFDQERHATGPAPGQIFDGDKH
jgi:hypothetical protein